LKESYIAKGRIGVYIPDHPKANSSGYVLRYRYLMEQKLGRFLLPEEHVHHKDGNKLNDSEDNLEILTRSEHTREHFKRKLDYDQIEKLKLQGIGYKTIAKRLGYPKSSTWCALKSMGHTKSKE
jgi:5-methylcytosine-specific restriction endonuclease McrA